MIAKIVLINEDVGLMGSAWFAYVEFKKFEELNQMNESMNKKEV